MGGGESMTYTKKQRDQYNHDRDITCERLGITKNEYNAFRRIGEQLHQIFEWSCNGYKGQEAIYEGNRIINEYTNEREEIDANPLYDKVYFLAGKHNLYVYIQTDPRGATIYLSKNPIPKNDYNRSAECIY